jgi:hypothetical protein
MSIQNAELYRRFVLDLQIEDCMVQVGSKWEAFADLTPQNYLAVLTRLKHQDLHIIGGIDPERGMNRARNEDVIWKNYFFIDFDIRDFWEKEYDDEISDTIIKEIAEGIIFTFSKRRLLREWRYVIFTGNGIHIYYFFEPYKVTSEKYWKAGVKRILEEGVQQCLDLPVDMACSNIGRLGRLPGSVNVKHGRKVLVEIINHQSVFLSHSSS